MNIFIAEALGTAFLALAVQAPQSSIYDDYQTSLALFLGILIFSNISGAHFNPSVSLFFYLKKSIKFSQLVLMVTAQVVGAGVGCYLGHLLYQVWNFPWSGDKELFQVGIAQTFGTFIFISLIEKSAGINSQLMPLVIPTFLFTAPYFTKCLNPAILVSMTVMHGLAEGWSNLQYQWVPLLAELAGSVFAWLSSVFLGKLLQGEWQSLSQKQ